MAPRERLYDRLMTVLFPEHLDLLRMHGRAAGHSLGQLSEGDALPPRGESALSVASEHWGTLEVWAWSVENPGLHWSQRAEPESSADYPTLVRETAAVLDRLVISLLSAGPGASIDYFGRPGTVADVARMLAHEAIAVAHAASLAAGRAPMVLSQAVASDGIDQSLGHWASSESNGAWEPETVAVRTTDTHDVWHLSLGRGSSNSEGEFRVVAPGVPAAVVEGPANHVLWWLHGYTTPADAVRLTGAPKRIRDLRSVLMHPEEEPLRRRRRWFLW